MSVFKEKVIKVVSLIPFGKVVSYGQVALYVGIPRAARQVGWILNGYNPSTGSGQGMVSEVEFIPWWRVVNNKGRISIKGSRYSAEDQKRLLTEEGIEVKDDLTFNIEKYRFIPDEKFMQSLQLDSVYLGMIGDKIKYNNKYQ